MQTTAGPIDSSREFCGESRDDEEPLNASILTEHTSLNGNDLGRSYGTLPSPTRSRDPTKKPSQTFNERRRRLPNTLNRLSTAFHRTHSLGTPASIHGHSTLRDFAYARLGSARPISAYDPPLTKKDDEEADGDAKINGIRVWYSSFTSIDWLHDAIKDSLRFSRLRKRKSIRARLRLAFDKSLGWIIVTIVGFLTAIVAFLVVRSEQLLFDFKEGYCADSWLKSKRFCCPATESGRVISPYASEELCDAWRSWSEVLSSYRGVEAELVEYVSYTGIAVRHFAFRLFLAFDVEPNSLS